MLQPSWTKGTIYYDGSKAWLLRALFQQGKLKREKWIRSPEHDGRAL